MLVKLDFVRQNGQDSVILLDKPGNRKSRTRARCTDFGRQNE